MITCIQNPGVIVTPNSAGKDCLRGKDTGNVLAIEGHSILCEGKKISDIIPDGKIKKTKIDKFIDVKGKVVFPGFVECHTHSVFAGSRASEYVLKLRGATYNEIASAGGGIVKTVNAVRSASPSGLYHLLKKRIEHFISQGVTTLEIKSGYGLDTETEIKMLKVIKRAAKNFPIDIVPTFLGAHTVPAEFKGDRGKYISLIINEMLPAIAKKNLARFCDGFCEQSAFTAEEIDQIFARAKELGLGLKLHTEQFTNIGGLQTAIKHNAVSADHLEVIREEDIPFISKSETVSVLLPAVSYFLNYDYAPARKLIEQNCIVALATDYNPGSSPVNNLGLIFSLAALKLKMSVEEIVTAYTLNAAKALSMSSETGTIEPGKQADFAVYDIEHYNDLPYYLSENRNVMTIKKAKVIYRNK